MARENGYGYYRIVRVSELSRQAGVPLSALKFYQREGLVPEGLRSSTNQVDYGTAHVARVRLIRALLDTGGLSVSATKSVLGVLDAADAPLAEAFHAAQQAMSTPRAKESVASAESRDRVRLLAESLGWNTTADNPGTGAAARALDGLHAIGFDAPPEYLRAYAAAAQAAAAADLHALTTLQETDRIAELMVVGTVLGDPLFAGLRRLAQEDATHHLFPVDQRRDQP
ncbi:MAG: putative transcriptional regulator, MerR family [Microbacteriaceae bacterium]|nr:putative transcriptional regulator, MerR family [Microbacteriaceae bacterium]